MVVVLRSLFFAFGFIVLASGTETSAAPVCGRSPIVKEWVCNEVNAGWKLRTLTSANGRWLFSTTNRRQTLFQVNPISKTTVVRWQSTQVPPRCSNPNVTFATSGDLMYFCGSTRIGSFSFGPKTLKPVKITMDNDGVVRFRGKMGWCMFFISSSGPSLKWVFVPQTTTTPKPTPTPTSTTTTFTMGMYTPTMHPSIKLRADCTYVPVPFWGHPSMTYNIEIVRCGPDIESADQQLVQAAQRWMKIINRDESDMDFRPSTSIGSTSNIPMARNITFVDDLLIFIEFPKIDGSGGILGSAGPRYYRWAIRYPSGITLTSVIGAINLDSDDVINMIKSNLFLNVVTHEMGHVLGIGSFWGSMSLLDPIDCSSRTGKEPFNAFFEGKMAMSVLGTIGAFNQTRPEVETSYGAGTSCVHWKETTYGTELMTGFISVSKGAKLSALTAASLMDLGYSVNMSSNAIDPFDVNSQVTLDLPEYDSLVRLQGCLDTAPMYPVRVV